MASAGQRGAQLGQATSTAKLAAPSSRSQHGFRGCVGSLRCGFVVVTSRRLPQARQPRRGTLTPKVSAAAASLPFIPPGLTIQELLATAIGYSVFVGACVRSMPQIIVMLQQRSAEGLALTSVVNELLCYTIVLAYNYSKAYPFNTYGEAAALWLQDVFIIMLIYKYRDFPAYVWAGSVLALALGSVYLFSGACPAEVLSALQLATLFVMALGSSIPQIWLNIQRGNSGVLSPITCGLNVAGCIARMYTTLVLTKDTLLLVSCATQGVLHCILLYQTIETMRMKATQAPSPSGTG